MRYFYRAKINFRHELKKGENIQKWESLKKPEQEHENEETSINNSTETSALERRKHGTSCRMSSFIAKLMI